MIRGLSCILCLCTTLFALGQTLPDRVVTLHDRAFSLSQSDLDSALLLLNEAEKLILEAKDSTMLSQNYWLRARAFYFDKSYDSVLYYSQKGLEPAQKYGDYTNLARFHNIRGVVYKRQNALVIAAREYQESLSYNLLSGDSMGASKTLLNIGKLYRQAGNPDSVVLYYRKGRDIRRRLKDTLGLANIYDQLASNYKSLGFYKQSLDSYYGALSIYESNQDSAGMGRVLFNIGALNTRMKLYEESISIYRENLSYYQGDDQKKDRADIYLNMADALLFAERTDSALIYLKRSEAIYREAGDKNDLSSVYHGYGRASAKMGRYNDAQKHYERSIDLKYQSDDQAGLANVRNSYGVTMYESGQYLAARIQYRKGLVLGEKLKKPHVIRASLLGLAETNEALGNSKIAYDYLHQYEVIKHSLDSVEKSRQIAELKEIYESEQKDKQIRQLELENEVVNAQSEANAAQAARQKADKLTFIVLAVALLILATIVYLYLRQRLALARLREKEEKEAHIKSVDELLTQQQTKTLEAMVQGQEQERVRIANELHDHFGSLMATVKVNLTTVTVNSDKGIVDDKQLNNLSLLVDQACDDIRSLSHSMHVGISENFGLVPALKDLAESVTASGRVRVTLHSASCEDKLDSAMEVMAYRLVQELMSNALKHAEATRLTVQITCLEELLNIIVEDNGKGFNAQYYMEQSRGMGLKSMQERISSLQGEFEVDSQPGKGTTVIIDLPASMEQKMTSI